MGYTGNRAIREMQKNCTFVRIHRGWVCARATSTDARGQPREAPNYPQDR